MRSRTEYTLVTNIVHQYMPLLSAFSAIACYALLRRMGRTSPFSP